MKVFSVTTGASRIEFSVYMVQGKYQARVNGLVIFESSDYQVISNIILDDLEANVRYNGTMH